MIKYLSKKYIDKIWLLLLFKSEKPKRRNVNDKKYNSFLQISKQAREELNNSICEKLDEFNRELKESRELQSIEFYEEVKNNRNWNFSSKRFELYQGKFLRKNMIDLRQR